MDPDELMLLKRYKEAIEIFTQEISKASKPYHLDFVGRATAYLCEENYEKALSDYIIADKVERQNLKSSGGFIENIAVIQWMIDDKNSAIQTARSAIEGLIKGEIEFADLAGGVGPGLLLWYMAVSLGYMDQKSYALKYLDRLTQKSRIKYWPGPLAKYVLEKIDFAEVLNSTSKPGNLAKSIKKAKKDILLRRELCQALFYHGVKKLERGDHEGFITEMKACFDLENPLIEHEWYLARYELKRNQ